MPTSMWNHISYVIEKIKEEQPKSVLDIGVGFGKMGFLCREYLDIYGKGNIWKKEDWTTIIDGIEIYEPYIKNMAKPWYNTIIIGDAVEELPRLLNYDLIIMGDVLEHIEKEKGLKLLDLIFKKSKMFILSIPLGDNWLYEWQGDNKAESHISKWYEEELKNYPKYKEHKIYTINKKKNRDVGVFIYK